MKKIMCLYVMATLCGSAAGAATMSFSDSYSDPLGSSVSLDLSVPRFDPTLGTLTQVDSSHSMTVEATATHSINCTSFDASLGFCTKQDGPSLLGYEASGEAIGPIGGLILQPYDIDFIDCEVVETQNMSCTKTETISATDSRNQTITGALLVAYIGPGGNLGSQFVQQNGDRITNASFSVTYTFDPAAATPVPLPASFFFLASVLGLLTVRRRLG